jgi:hypothetical protein
MMGHIRFVEGYPVCCQLRWARLPISVGLLLLWSLSPAARAEEEVSALTVGSSAEGAPVLVNPGMECSQGYVTQPGINGSVPKGWTALLSSGQPRLNSTRIEFAGSCGGSGFIERLEGEDSLVFLSQNIETPPSPGKPFDAMVYQQVAVTAGTAYSLSGWMVSLCGGSAIPNDCPQGYYIAKMLGIDPAGGTDPLAPGVIWVEDLRNFTESRWVNLRLGTTARSGTLTVFARIRSPFRWHGAHAFVDAYSLVRAPAVHFVDLPATVQGMQVTIRWDGVQSPDIAAIPGGTYRLLYDIQYRRGDAGAWTDWQAGQPAGQAPFTVSACPSSQAYQFRARARAEQPEGSSGAWPNHRYPGDWTSPASVLFLGNMPCVPRAFLPMASFSGG